MQAITYLNKFISSCQHGFIKGRSCTTQLLDTIDTWTRLLDKGSAVDTVYLDFAKAFDSVPHRRLLMKLEAYGIKGALLKWLESFLTGRKQRVALNENLSSWTSVNSGVPRGSVLGPLLFICYVNDMPEVANCTLNMFADDTTIFFIDEGSRTRGHNLKLVKEHCRKDMRKKFFSLRVNSLWNKLPSNVVSADTLNSFKSRLDALFGDKKYSCSKEDILSTV